jgi:hypothetical protein
MSLLHPSRATRTLLKLASFGLAGLLAGLLTGCSSNSNRLLTHNDTYWHPASTYASATSSLPPRNTVRSTHTRPCFDAACQLHATTAHFHHRQM